MLPVFLLEEQSVKENGAGPAVPVQAGERIQVTLGILDAKEQQSLDIGIFTSSDGETWGAKPFSAFPQKFSRGTSSLVVDLASAPEAHFVRVGYKLNRWGHWKDGPEFRLYVFGETLS